MSTKINSDLETIARHVGVDLMKLESFVACAEMCGYKFVRPDSPLVAAAPSLLEALKTLVLEEFRDDDDPILDRARIQARNAIAKAEGK